MLPFARRDVLHGRCETVSVLILDYNNAGRERRAECLRRWGHVVQSYSAPAQLLKLPELPPKAVLIARQELPRVPGLECIRKVQLVRSDIPAILLAKSWSAALAAAVSSRASIWLRHEPVSDEELHGLVDFCAPY